MFGSLPLGILSRLVRLLLIHTPWETSQEINSLRKGVNITPGPEQIINSTLRQPQYELRVRKMADHIILRQFRYQVQIQHRGNDFQLIISSPTTNSNRDNPNPPLINSRTRATGIPILTAMTGGITHPNQTIMAQKVLLLGTTEPLNAPGMARPTRAVGVLQSAQTDLFSAIIEIVENVLQLTVSGVNI
ncbi:hypothetical protein BGX38DRAFT_1267051 [Terfezia claveryi]|nr:hypothetical protein BGX38DRAFT_1267051 [Terfezia claveryi]